MTPATTIKSEKLDPSVLGRPVVRWLNPEVMLQREGADAVTAFLGSLDVEALLVAEAASHQIALIESLVRAHFRPICAGLVLVLHTHRLRTSGAASGFRVRPGSLNDRRILGSKFFPWMSLGHAADSANVRLGRRRNFLLDESEWLERDFLVVEQTKVLTTVAGALIDPFDSSVARIVPVFDRDSSWGAVSHLIERTTVWLLEEGVGTIVVEVDPRFVELLRLLLKAGFVARQTRSYFHWAERERYRATDEPSLPDTNHSS